MRKTAEKYIDPLHLIASVEHQNLIFSVSSLSEPEVEEFGYTHWEQIHITGQLHEVQHGISSFDVTIGRLSQTYYDQMQKRSAGRKPRRKLGDLELVGGMAVVSMGLAGPHFDRLRGLVGSKKLSTVTLDFVPSTDWEIHSLVYFQATTDPDFSSLDEIERDYHFELTEMLR